LKKSLHYNNAAIKAYNKAQYKDAEILFKKAITEDKNYAEAYSNLGALYAKFKLYDKAIELYKKAIALKPSYAGAYTNLGNALNKMKRHEEAVYFHKLAIALDSKAANHYSNCASAYKNLGRFKEARILYEQAIKLDPTHVNAHFDLATVLLQTKAYEQGWREYEWRFQKEEMRGHILKHKEIFSAPRYQGEELAGESVLVHTEQGFGDTLMMARYLKLLKEKGAYVILLLRDGLEELFETFSYVDEIIMRESDTLTKFDYQLPFMSLAMLFDPKLQNVQKVYPYIEVSKKYPLKTDKIKIGIAWGASNTGDSYTDKVFDLRHFEKMAQAKELQLYSLQVGPDAYDLHKYSMQDDIIDLSKYIDNFYTTATMIKAMDLIITSDTSVAHLAGAMGKKVWILLQKVPDWRWGIHECVSEWYPSARLFRQYSLGDFNSVFAEVYKALEKEYNMKVLDD